MFNIYHGDGDGCTKDFNALAKYLGKADITVRKRNAHYTWDDKSYKFLLSHSNSNISESEIEHITGL